VPRAVCAGKSGKQIIEGVILLDDEDHVLDGTAFAVVTEDVLPAGRRREAVNDQSRQETGDHDQTCAHSSTAKTHSSLPSPSRAYYARSAGMQCNRKNTLVRATPCTERSLARHTVVGAVPVCRPARLRGP